MMSVHDALQAWQDGEISTSRALSLTGATNILELYGLAEACDVEIRTDLNASQMAGVEEVSAAVQRALGHELTGPSGPGTRAA